MKWKIKVMIQTTNQSCFDVFLKLSQKYGAEFMILQIRAIPQFRNFPEVNFAFQNFQDRKSMKICGHVLFLSCFKQPLSTISDIFRRVLNEWPQSHLAANPFSTNMAN